MNPSFSSIHRVLMTTDTVGGVWTYALELCRGLQANGVEVVLATLGPRAKPDQRDEAAALPNVILQESSYALEWMDDPWSDVTAAGEWLLALENAYKPDVVHLNGYAHGALPWNAPCIVTGHSCVYSWWRAVKNQPAPAVWTVYQRRIREGLQVASAVVAPTAWMAGELAAHYGIDREVRVIPNGRDLPERPARTKESFVLSVGRLWDEAKNIQTLASAAPHIPWVVQVAGEAARPGGIPVDWPNVQSLGYLSRERVLALMERAALYVLPAKYEPFGLSPLEAAACGCALVLGNIPSLREVWGEAAVYVPVNQPDLLAATLRSLIANPERLRDCAQAARARAAEYNRGRMTQQYLELYTQLIPAAVQGGQEDLVLKT